MPALLNSTSYRFIYGGGAEYNAYVNGRKIFPNLSNISYVRSYSSDLVWDTDSSSYKSPVTITINPTPSDATVVLTANGFTQSGNSITVGAGTNVTYTVSKTGYNTETSTISYTTNQNISVNLSVQQLTLTVNPTPADSTVTFSAGNYSSQSGNSITVPYGTLVNYTASRTGLNSVTGSETITSNVTRNAILTYSITLHCDGTEWDEHDSYTILGNKVNLLYKWRYPQFRIYVNNVKVLDNVKPNNTFNIQGVLPGNAYNITQTRKYVDWNNNSSIKWATEQFSSGTLPSPNGLTITVDITTDHDGGSAMSTQYANQASYDVYITT